MEMQDISLETFGKYQYCTQYKGRWFSDADFSAGKLRDGSLSDPFNSPRVIYSKGIFKESFTEISTTPTKQ